MSKKCYYCEQHKNPDYKRVNELKKFVFEGTRMKPARTTGLCGKHQRALKRAIANAHHLALM
ncbi:MAG: 30S ribosomal protein S18 [Clostridium sp. 26_22]|nr:MAG: 30S ribosomal protein S18 [Clostridium sp. 26_22]